MAIPIEIGMAGMHYLLYLAESFLYRIEIRRVGRQVDQLATPLLDQLPHSGRFVCGEVVHDHHLSGF